MVTQKPPDAQPSAGAADLAGFIHQHRDAILEEWEALVCQLPSARKLSRPALLDHVPDVLGGIEALAREIGAGRKAEPPRATAARHALHRLDEGFDLAEVVLEYSVLRDCILRSWLRDRVGPECVAGISVLNQAIDHAIAGSVDCYAQTRDRTLQALDRISSAALESHSLDELLQKLLRALVETTEAADTALILLRDGDLLRARAAVGLEEELARGFSIRIGEGFTGTIALEGKPKLLRAAASDALVKSDVIRARGVRALYGVPLMESGEVIGVAHIGSLSAYDFSEQDKRLLLAMANRATAAVSQHMLRQREQQARDEAQSAVALLESERQWLRAVLDQLPAGVIIAEARSGKLTFANRQAEKLLGRPLIAGRSVMEDDQLPIIDISGARVPVQDLPLARAVQGEAVLGAELTIPRPELDPITVRANAVPIRSPSGEVTGAVVAFDDITARKRAEDEQTFLKEATALLASSLDHREILASIAKLAVPALADWCAVEIVQGDGSEQLAIEHVDPAKIELARELRRRFPPDPNASTGVPHVLRTGQAELYEDISDELLVRATRGPEHLELARRLGLRSAMVVPMVAHGRIVGAISFVCAESRRRYGPRDMEVAQELAARAALALDNARLYREAQEAVRAREAVLAVVSHDLKNPLGAIHMSAALLLRRATVQDPASRKQLETIQRATGRMEHLIADLLDMASIHAGRLSVEKKVTDGEPLIREAIELNEPLAAEKGIQLERECELEGLELLCDRDRVFQVFANLLGNAIKFGRRGDRITVRARPREGELHVTVSDTGPGIAPDELQHVFEPYWSGERHSKKGTGLGLFITQGIIEAHGGRISAESTPGVGTAFHFTLPLARVADAAEPS